MIYFQAGCFIVSCAAACMSIRSACQSIASRRRIEQLRRRPR